MAAQRSPSIPNPAWYTKPRPTSASTAEMAAFEERKELFLRAAEVVLRREGRDAPVSKIAKQAGVGMSSFYRTFDSKDELLDLLATDRAELWKSVWSKVLDSGDPHTGVFDALAELTTIERADPTLARVFRTQVLAKPSLIAEVREIAIKVLTRSQHTGAVRSDATVDDVTRILMMLAALPYDDEQTGRRMLALIVEGLSHEDQPLPVQ